MIHRCNTCGGTYPDTDRDGAPYYHACSPEVVTHAVCDASGVVREAEKRTPRENCRDERLAPGTVTIDGTVVQASPHAEEPGQVIYKPGSHRMVSEGAGRRQVKA